ncbi:hypothetical protein psal_cds_270 [Pandoravirus salinus]|uniref:Uncharacterized protein n=1 Tax=Pandoravirus salinus TaxID=1349410 RepID=S4VTN7_9VIRU|nr:hypothetical protein psal_cds_270 [Pandoravirus salinus]AGO83849.1 hypothetical protein psal_cds_270 [Pandoravirus salinus]
MPRDRDKKRAQIIVKNGSEKMQQQQRQPQRPGNARWASPYTTLCDPRHPFPGTDSRRVVADMAHVTQWPRTLRPEPETSAAEHRHDRWPAAGPFASINNNNSNP